MADSITSLTMTEPEEGGQVTGRTVVRVLASGDALVFGINLQLNPIGIALPEFVTTALVHVI